MIFIRSLIAGLSRHPSWISTWALILCISLTENPQNAWLWLGLILISLIVCPKPRVRVFLAFALLGAIRIWISSPEQDFRALASLPGSWATTIESTERTSTGFRFLLRLPDGTTALLRGETSLHPLPLPGDSGQVSAAWEEIRPLTVPGAFDQGRWLKSLRACATGKILTWKPLHSQWTSQRFAFHARAWLRAQCSASMSKGTSGVMVALLVGDKSGLDQEVSQDFRNTGLIHILTVSGFHIVFLSGFLQLFLRALRIPSPISRWMAVAFLLVFIPITGASASVERAVLMFILIQTTQALQRTPLSLHALGVACSAILLIDPPSLYDIGFQLSCGATAGILLGQGAKVHTDFEIPTFLKRWILEPTWVTLCATAGTFPLLILHFQSFSPISLVGNLAVVPLMELAMQAGIFLSLTSAVPFFAHPFGAAASLCIQASLVLTDWFAKMPGAALGIGPWPLWLCLWLQCSLLSLIVALRKRSRLARWVAVSGIFIWAVWGGFSIGLPAWNSTPLTVYFLDTDQGDATLLSFPNGINILVDVGNGKQHGSYGLRTLVPFLRQIGVSKLDALIITHPDLDHYGGAVSLVQNFPVRTLWFNGATRSCEKSEWIRLMKLVQRKQIPMRMLYSGAQIFGLGAWKLRCLHAGNELIGEDWNAGSVAIRLEAKQGPILLMTGDLGIHEEEQLIRNGLSHIPILKLGHHGSKHSSAPEFLAKLQPQIAIISAGRQNHYGHPSPSVIHLLDSMGIKHWNTASEGSLLLRIANDSVELSGYRDGEIPVFQGKLFARLIH